MTDIKEYLNIHNIKFKLFKHLPVYTCKEVKKYSSELKGIHLKNLFMKSKKSEDYFLVIIPEYKRLEIKYLEKILNNKLTFSKEKELESVLGLSSGAVSPFGLINDKNLVTSLIIYKEVLKSEFVSFHPNINTETLELTKENFMKFLDLLKNRIIIL
jgi:Ala-tRNA(Pro) deacylase